MRFRENPQNPVGLFKLRIGKVFGSFLRPQPEQRVFLRLISATVGGCSGPVRSGSQALPGNAGSEAPPPLWSGAGIVVLDDRFVRAHRWSGQSPDGMGSQAEPGNQMAVAAERSAELRA